MIILKILGLLFWLLVIPVGLGLLFRKAPEREHLPERLQTTGVTLLIGYLLLFALLEIVGIPVMLLSVYHGYSRMVVLYAVLQVLGAGTGYGKEEGTENEPAYYSKGNETFCMASEGAL